MSGGIFDYRQFNIESIAEEIEEIINRQGKERPRDNCHSKEWYDKYPEDRFYPTYSKEEVQEKLKEAVKALRVAYVYAHRVDRFFAGDDGEEFMEKIDKELKEL